MKSSNDKLRKSTKWDESVNWRVAKEKLRKKKEESEAECAVEREREREREREGRWNEI